MMNLNELYAKISANFWKAEQVASWVERQFVHRRHFPGGGVVDLGNYTLTVPATGTAALLGTTQTFTALKTFSAGISFGNETLSVYDELTSFDVFIGGSGGNPTVAFTVNNGTHVRVGGVVHAWGQAYISSISGGSGQVRVTLPVTVGATQELYPMAGYWYDASANLFKPVTFVAQTGAAHALVLNGATAGDAMQVSELAAGDRLVYGGSYRV